MAAVRFRRIAWLAAVGLSAAAALPWSTARAGDGDSFPRYAVLEPNVAFWTRVFSEYSENQSVVHAVDYPQVVLEVLDFRSQATLMSDVQLQRERSKREAEAVKRFGAVLRQIAVTDNPDALQGEARRVYRLFDGITDKTRFKTDVRVQRGLRERTQVALETSGRYLPQMERVFDSYALPLRLTRLPLVESSFNVDAYSRLGAAGLWQFIPSSARIYMRLDDVVDDRRDPWASTDGAARHLRDDYAALGSWPLAVTAYNHGRSGIARGLAKTGGKTLADLVRDYDAKNFGFASRNFYAEFLAASDVERNWRQHFSGLRRAEPIEFDEVEVRDFVRYDKLRELCAADEEVFRRLNPAYRPAVLEGKLYVPPGSTIRVPQGTAKQFELAYAGLDSSERFTKQRIDYVTHRVSKGETLSGIAKRYGVSQASIMAANDIQRANQLRIGKVLKIRREDHGAASVASRRSSQPRRAAATTTTGDAAYRLHRVRSGQTLSSIAQIYKVSVRDLRRANQLGSSSHIRAGARLRVPLR